MITLFGYLLYFVVAALAVFLMREFRLAMSSIRALRWRQITGQLIRQDVAGGAQLSGAPSRIRYAFTVEGADYSSDHIGFGFPDKLEGLLARGVVDSLLTKAPDVAVFYDPRKPENSVLIAGYQPYHAWRSGVSLVALLVIYFWAQTLVG